MKLLEMHIHIKKEGKDETSYKSMHMIGPDIPCEICGKLSKYFAIVNENVSSTLSER